MAGFIWVAENQPNICEAATSFTFSSLNLMIAIPMFLVDTLFSAVSVLASLFWVLVAPPLEYTVYGAGLLVELVGVEELPSNLALVLLLLVSAGVYHAVAVLGPRAGGSMDQVFSRLLVLPLALLWISAFLTAEEYESAAVPKLVHLYFAWSFGALAVRAFFNDYNRYKKIAEKPMVQSSGEIFTDLLMHESISVLLVAAFGYPTFTLEDDWSRYLCIVPLEAVFILYHGMPRPVPAPPVLNGVAHPISETGVPVAADTNAPAADTNAAAADTNAAAADTNTAAADISETEVPVAADTNAVTTDTNAAAADTNAGEPEAPGIDTADAAPAQAEEGEGESEEKSEQCAAAGTDEVTEDKAEKDADITEDGIGEVSNCVDDAAQVEVKCADIRTAKLMTVVFAYSTCFLTTLTGLVTPLVAVGQHASAMLINLPWTFLLSTLILTCSHLLAAYAWFTLTGNNAAVLLPVFSVLFPAAINKMEAFIPARLRQVLAEVPCLGMLATEYILVSSTVLF